MLNPQNSIDRKSKPGKIVLRAEIKRQKSASYQKFAKHIHYPGRTFFSSPELGLSSGSPFFISNPKVPFEALALMYPPPARYL